MGILDLLNSLRNPVPMTSRNVVMPSAHGLSHLPLPIRGQVMQRHGVQSNYATPIQGLQNPGYTPMQGGNLNYRSAPQPATFNPIQNSNANLQKATIRF